MTAVGRNWGLLQVRNLLIRGALIPIWKPSSTHTSNDVVQRIKGELRRNVERLKEAALPTERKFSIPRISVGHGGTLDPFASGVIVLGLTQGCKRLSHFLHCDKEYLVTATLGMATDTYDRMGQVQKEAPWQHITRADIERVLPKQRGQFMQETPMFSARSVGGQRLYKLARKGEVVERPSKEVNVLKLECIDFTPPNFTLSLVVSAGTYVRSIVHEIGNDLGCYAYSSELVRTRQGVFSESDCLFEKDWQFEKIMDAAYRTSLTITEEGDLLKSKTVQASRPLRAHSDNEELLKSFMRGEVDTLPSSILTPSTSLRTSSKPTKTTKAQKETKMESAVEEANSTRKEKIAPE